jgi:hypothetical protein
MNEMAPQDRPTIRPTWRQVSVIFLNDVILNNIIICPKDLDRSLTSVYK